MQPTLRRSEVLEHDRIQDPLWILQRCASDTGGSRLMIDCKTAPLVLPCRQPRPKGPSGHACRPVERDPHSVGWDGNKESNMLRIECEFAELRTQSTVPERTHILKCARMRNNLDPALLSLLLSLWSSTVLKHVHLALRTDPLPGRILVFGDPWQETGRETTLWLHGGRDASSESPTSAALLRWRGIERLR